MWNAISQSRIWTRVVVSLSCDDNHYTTGTSNSETSSHDSIWEEWKFGIILDAKNFYSTPNWLDVKWTQAAGDRHLKKASQLTLCRDWSPIRNLLGEEGYGERQKEDFRSLEYHQDIGTLSC